MDDQNNKLDLRGGRSLWEASIGLHATSALKESIRTRILIIGAGITGSFLAEALSRNYLIDRRDRCPHKIAAKANIIRRKFKELYPRFEGETEYAWAGFFGLTSDGLPLIGSLPGHRRIFAAFGYGGNGITFSYMAAQLIAREIAGVADPLMQYFAIDRE